MKKIYLPFVLGLFLISTTSVFAAGLGQACSNNNDCDGDYICTKKICAVDPSFVAPTPTGTAAPAGTPAPDGKPASTGTPAPAATAAAPGGGTESGASNFVALTNLPGVKDLAAQNNLPAFFNTIYKICIGVAASLAVLQIMLAGVMYMGGDSVTETKQAKEKIQNAVLGLVLVLSPYIVFSIINPKLLDLQIGFSGLAPKGTTPFVQGSTQQTLFTNGSLSFTDAKSHCDQAGGTALFECVTPGKGSRTVAATDSCTKDEKPFTVCRASEDVPTSVASCKVQYGSLVIPSNKVCDQNNGYEAVPAGCCNIPSGSPGICCGMVARGAVGGLGGDCYPDNTCSAQFGCVLATHKCAVNTSVNAKGSYISVTDFVFDSAGQHDDKGPIPSDKANYDDMISTCKDSNGTIKITYGPIASCPVSIHPSTLFPSTISPYIRCVPTTLNCR
jgi:hypothetical protein